MALPRGLFALALALRLQMTLGQQLSAGSVESTKLPVYKNKDIDSLAVAKRFDSIIKMHKMRLNENMKANAFNNTESKSGNETDIRMTNVDFSRNQLHSTTPAMLNGNAYASQSLFGHPIGVPLISYFKPSTNQVNTASSGAVPDPPASARPPGAEPRPAPPPSRPHLPSAQPTFSPIPFAPSFVSLQTIGAPSQNQAAHQTLPSFLIQPLNMQSQVKYMHSVPAEPAQRAMEDIVHNGQSLTSLMLSHILSRGCNTKDSSTPIQSRSQSRAPKQSNDKTLLSLLKLLNEKNQFASKAEKPDIIHNNGLKRGKLDDRFEMDSLEDNSSESDASEHVDGAGGRARGARGGEEDYCSDESSDYTDENYDDE